jgi:hypothetical protein
MALPAGRHDDAGHSPIQSPAMTSLPLSLTSSLPASLFPSLTRTPSPAARSARVVAMAAASDSGGCGDDAGPAGCGWFDSSHDLLAGLCVTELAPSEEVAALLRFIP